MTIEDILKGVANLPAANIACTVNDKLAERNILIVTAPPGAGKSTLLPLTIMAGNIVEGKIIIIEPRRLAVRQVAERMACILGEPVGKTVGYRMRFENRTSSDTRIEVVTEGVLMRMLVADSTLEGVGMVIFDEYHERSLTSDLDMAFVRHLQTIIRDELKVVIMSATINVSSLSKELNAPVIESEGRLFPVNIKYVEDDLMTFLSDRETLVRSISRTISIAHNENDGDILVFLPGQWEIQRVTELLSDSLGATHILPLYANLPPESQRMALIPSVYGERKVVLATPVAETSLTIESVQVVIDSGLCRKPVFNTRCGFTQLETVIISKDMMKQRTGRAGRVSEGVCYRMWSKVAEHKFAEQRQPEIISADLSPIILNVAALGESDIEALPWITPPPHPNVMKARRLLQWLVAIDNNGDITKEGRLLAEMPCHPRIARMILSGKTNHMKALACDIAAILEEKDTFIEGSSSDINLRLDALRLSRRRKQSGRWKRIMMIAQEYRHIAGVKEDNDAVGPYDSGLLIAYAYPERVAVAINKIGGFRMANGENIFMSANDDMAAREWIAIGTLNYSGGRVSRVALASVVSPDALPLRDYENLMWNSKLGCVIMNHERRIGKLVVDSMPLQMADNRAVSDTICEAMKKDALSMLNWDDSVERLQNRVSQVALWHPELNLPDISTAHLAITAHNWLPFYLVNGTRIMSTSAEMKKLNLHNIIWANIPYEQQLEINRLAPTHITLPSGRRVMIDYRPTATAPVVSVRLQECGSPDNVRGKHYPNISTKHDRLSEKMFTFAV